MKEGDAVTVKIIKVANGKVSLSIKALEDDKEAARKQKKLEWNTQKMQLEQVLVTYLQISNYRKEHIWQDQVLAQIFELQHGGKLMVQA